VSVDVLIVGGGLAGSAAAIMLARAGRSVVLVERESLPQHKVCGEFLSQEAMTYLSSLGIDLIGLGAVAIRSVRLAGRAGQSEAMLPFAAMSLTRQRLERGTVACCGECGRQGAARLSCAGNSALGRGLGCRYG